MAWRLIMAAKQQLFSWRSARFLRHENRRHQKTAKLQQAASFHRNATSGENNAFSAAAWQNISNTLAPCIAYVCSATIAPVVCCTHLLGK